MGRQGPAFAGRVEHDRVDPRDLPVALRPLVGHLPLDLLCRAADHAARIGASPEAVLIARGWLTADAYAERAAAWLGLPFEPLEHDPPAGTPAPAVEAAAAGLVAVGAGPRGLVVAVAARGPAVTGLADLLRRDPAAATHLRVTSPARLQAHVRRRADRALAEQAASGLLRQWPDMSAGMPWRPRPTAIALAVLALAVPLALAPAATAAVVHILLSAGFLAWAVLRALALVRRRVRPVAHWPLPDADLPLYTVLVPLYREARMVEGLVAALGRLDYPPEKLDIKFVVEADDVETRAALAAAAPPPHCDVVVAPALGPRTKPKALCAALPFARGRFVVVYDAEDRPDPGQLRRALAAFRYWGRSVGCVQARLVIDNARDGWLTRHFAAEYAALFDVLLPMLVGLGLPIPLGGTSNHFRIEALRMVGAWDPYNVTEDADLGMRLARFDWRTVMIESDTREEAPRRAGAWLRQRTRWFKGWIQTWFVHMRRPADLARDLGAGGFVAFQLMVGGTVLSALIHPLFLALLAIQAATGRLLVTDGVVGATLAGLTVTTLVCGYGASGLLGLAGLSRRGLASIAWVLLTMPAYWLLLSAAAWRAVWQLAVDPFRWEKTEHGLARTSLGPGASAAVARQRLVTDTAATRRRRPRAAA